MDQSREPDPSIRRVRLLHRDKAARSSLRRRMPQARLRQGIYLLPSLFTAGNLFCGFFSMISTYNGEYHRAALLVLVAYLLDGLDGAVARLTSTASQFGIEFDSLADVVSFGVAPAMLAYAFALTSWGTWGALAAGLFAVCGALRLARFNVQAVASDKRYFTGLPIPAAAGTIAATIFVYYLLGAQDGGAKSFVFLFLVYALAGLMVSNFRYFSLKQQHLKTRSPFWILLSAVLLLILSIAMWRIMLFTGLLLYTLSGPLLWLWSFQKQRREKGSLV